MNRPSYRRCVSVEDDGKPSLISINDYQEEIFHHFENIEFSFSSDSAESNGIGNLYITTGRIIWIADNISNSTVNKMFDFDIPYIVLHAMTHDEATYPKPCLYCQLDASSEDDEEAFEECFFVPSDEATLQKLFETFSEAAQRNPDADDNEDDDYFGVTSDELIYNVEEVRMGAEEARRLQHLESVFNVPTTFRRDDDQFEDAEEENMIVDSISNS